MSVTSPALESIETSDSGSRPDIFQDLLVRKPLQVKICSAALPADVPKQNVVGLSVIRKGVKREPHFLHRLRANAGQAVREEEQAIVSDRLIRPLA